MGILKFPKYLLVNKEEQLDVKFYDASGAPVNVFAANHTMIASNLGMLKKSQIVSSIKNPAVDPVKGVYRITFNGTVPDEVEANMYLNIKDLFGQKASQAPDGEKYFFDLETPEGVVTGSALAALWRQRLQRSTPNARYENLPFEVGGTGANVDITMKNFYEKLEPVGIRGFEDYFSFIVTTAPTEGKGTEHILSQQISNRFGAYTVEEWAEKPQPGVKYKQYLITYTGSDEETGGDTVPDQLINTKRTIEIFVNEALTALIAKLDLT